MNRLFANGVGLLGSYAVSFASFFNGLDLIPILSEIIGSVTALAGAYLTFALAKQHLANARKAKAEAHEIEVDTYLKEKKLTHGPSEPRREPPNP